MRSVLFEGDEYGDESCDEMPFGLPLNDIGCVQAAEGAAADPGPAAGTRKMIACSHALQPRTNPRRRRLRRRHPMPIVPVGII